MNKQQSELQRLLQLVDNMSSHSKSQKDLLSYYLENVQGLKIDISDNGQVSSHLHKN